MQLGEPAEPVEAGFVKGARAVDLALGSVFIQPISLQRPKCALLDTSQLV